MPNQKNKVIAGILAIFFGTFGIHKLYLGRTGQFIWFIILFIISINMNFPVTAFLGMIQGLILLFMPDTEFDKKYNRGFIAERRGPLDVRREEQLKRHHQLPGQHPSKNNNNFKSAQSVVKANSLKNSGIKKYKEFDLEEAIIDFKAGLEMMPNDPALHFNLACAYSLTEQKELAFKHISLSVANGLKESERILNHEDLAFIRIQPEFETFRKNGFKQLSSMSAKEPKVSESQAQDTDIDAKPLELNDTLLSKLKKLAELRDSGIISDQEFDFERKKVMRQ